MGQHSHSFMDLFIKCGKYILSSSIRHVTKLDKKKICSVFCQIQCQMFPAISLQRDMNIFVPDPQEDTQLFASINAAWKQTNKKVKIQIFNNARVK